MGAILVTGATGFVGRVVIASLKMRGEKIRCVVRKNSNVDCQYLYNKFQLGEFDQIIVKDISSNTNWGNSLNGVEAVIHLAGRAHVMNEDREKAKAKYFELNTLGTKKLAETAADQGVKRLIFVSTIKVNGETTVDKPFKEEDSVSPTDPYALSKWEAEKILHSVSKKTGMEVVIVRPPLVYGPNVKGNMIRLLRLVDKGVPLPLANVNNCRTMIAVENLADFLAQCLRNKNIAGKTLLPTDGSNLSTTELLNNIALFTKRELRLFYMPKSFLKLSASLIGKRDICDRLTSSLVVDGKETKRLLGWSPKVPVYEALKRMTDWYLFQRRGET